MPVRWRATTLPHGVSTLYKNRYSRMCVQRQGRSSSSVLSSVVSRSRVPKFITRNGCHRHWEFAAVAASACRLFLTSRHCDSSCSLLVRRIMSTRILLAALVLGVVVALEETTVSSTEDTTGAAHAVVEYHLQTSLVIEQSRTDGGDPALKPLLGGVSRDEALAMAIRRVGRSEQDLAAYNLRREDAARNPELFPKLKRRLAASNVIVFMLKKLESPTRAERKYINKYLHNERQIRKRINVLLAARKVRKPAEARKVRKPAESTNNNAPERHTPSKPLDAMKIICGVVIAVSVLAICAALYVVVCAITSPRRVPVEPHEEEPPTGHNVFQIPSAPPMYYEEYTTQKV